jgi:hypothetical protein
LVKTFRQDARWRKSVPNSLLQLIIDGRIASLEDLRSTYHKLMMQTHPDAVGSDKLVRKFLQFGEYYEEAKAFLLQSTEKSHLPVETAGVNHRLGFYKELFLIESLEMPYGFHPEENRQGTEKARQNAISELSAWRPDMVELYRKADEEHSRIKREKPMGPYMKHALALNVRPLIHNILAYQLTGRMVYAKQSRQNLNAIMQKVAQGGCKALHGFLTFMIEDTHSIAAVLE